MARGKKKKTFSKVVKYGESEDGYDDDDDHDHDELITF